MPLIKMFLDDSLHHTYNYVDQPFCYYINLGHYLISVLLVAVLGGNATFCNEVVLVYSTLIYSLLQLPFILHILIN